MAFDESLAERTAAKPAMLIFAKAKRLSDSVRTYRKLKPELGFTCLQT